MIFKKIKLKGAFIIEIDPIKDRRGFFSRSFCQNEFRQQGLDFKVIQSSISYNKVKGTLRGMHYQISPYAEEKLVSCTRGKIYDVIIDLRPNSLTYCQWLAVELSAANFKMLYIPKGFAHGFQTLCDNAIVFYQISKFYHPQSARGIRWDDSIFGIKWPKVSNRIISKTDQGYKDFLKIQYHKD